MYVVLAEKKMKTIFRVWKVENKNKIKSCENQFTKLCLKCFLDEIFVSKSGRHILTQTRKWKKKSNIYILTFYLFEFYKPRDDAMRIGKRKKRQLEEEEKNCESLQKMKTFISESTFYE